MRTHPHTPTGETGSSSGPPPPPPSGRALARRILAGLRGDLDTLEGAAAKLGEEIARTRARVVSLEALLAYVPASTLIKVHGIQVGAMAVSGSRPETIPPWLAYLLEPLFTAIDNVQEQARTLRGELLRLEPETLRRFKEGVSTGDDARKLATKTRTGETWIPVKRPSAQESAPETIASSDQTHPEDLRWLASEQARIDAQRDRELSELQRILEERLGAAAVDEIIGGADPLDLCRAAGIEITADLERILERLKGYQEGDEG